MPILLQIIMEYSTLKFRLYACWDKCIKLYILVHYDIEIDHQNGENTLQI